MIPLLLKRIIYEKYIIQQPFKIMLCIICINQKIKICSPSLVHQFFHL